ncbi:xanthine dehydrogenase accessory protein XdhC [Alteromonas sp. D210916BOD_24]|uniref:xanthine dehydrogenase accessory protein XdhC n=1 Tax=Alteromonas sp. D210916BOD_24 TaxID=3157618 RepID=UPI00399C5F56
MNINTWRPHTWYEGIERCQQQNEAYVLVTVVSAAGSTPRDTGSKMVVTASECIDTIGGGHLEFDAIQRARDYLAKGETRTELHSYPLKSALGQCCGGAVKVLFDVCNLHQQHLAVFGAGHVAKALIPILAQLPVHIKWIDSRDALFPQELPGNVTQVVEEEPDSEVPHLPQKSWLIVLTHDHQLDYRIVEKALAYPTLSFVGLIGSDTKAKRFKTKLTHRGFSDDDLTRLYCPIGNSDVPGKRPIEVAVSIAAQIIAQLHLSQDSALVDSTTMPSIQAKENTSDIR